MNTHNKLRSMIIIFLLIVVHTSSLYGMHEEIAQYGNDDSSPCSLSYSPDGTRLAIAQGKSVLIWDLQKNDCAQIFYMKDILLSIQFLNDADSLLVSYGLLKPKLHKKNSFTGEVIKKYTLPESVLCNCCSTDGSSSLYAPIANPTPTLWDLEQKKALKEFNNEESDTFLALAISADNALYALGGNNQVVKIFNLDSDHESVHLPHSSRINALAFSHDATRIAAGTAYGIIKIWDITSQKSTQEIKTEKSIMALAYSPDAKTIAYANAQHLSLWNIETNTQSHIKLP